MSRKRWHPAVEWLHLPLTVAGVIVLFPFALPIALFEQGLIDRRRRQRAAQTACERCGTVLGEAALTQADSVWAAHVEKLHRDNPGMRFRLVRTVWAICPECGQEYGYDEKQDAFIRPLSQPGV